MSRVKIALCIGLCFFVNAAYCQMPGGGMSPPDFDAEKAAGIYTYNMEKVIKKLKLKDSPHKKAATEALYVFNIKMSELSAENALMFKQLNNDFDQNVQVAIQRRDRSVMNEVKAEIQAKIPPIRQAVTQEEIVLNEAMASILSEEQNKKWLKYQKQQKGTVNSFP